MPWPWLTPAIAFAALLVSGLTYRIVRRQAAVSWTVEMTEFEANRFDLVVTRPHGPAARNVCIDTVPVGHRVAAGTTGPIERLDPGGYTSLMLLGHIGIERPQQITISWDGWLGRRRKWQSGL